MGKRSHSSAEEKELRKKARMERNRISAARHRQSQRDLIESLKQQLAEARAELDRYKRGLCGPDPSFIAEAAVFTLFGPSQQ